MRRLRCGIIEAGWLLLLIAGCSTEPSFRFDIDRTVWLQDDRNHATTSMELVLSFDGRDRVFAWPDASSRTSYQVIGRDSAEVSARVQGMEQGNGGGLTKVVREGDVLCVVDEARYQRCTRPDGDPSECSCASLGIEEDAGVEPEASVEPDGQVPSSCADERSLSACSSSPCLVSEIITAQAGGSQLEVDERFMFFLAERQRLSRMDLVSGETLDLAEPGSITGMAQDETYVYWSDFNASVMRVPKGGGESEEMFRVVGNPRGIAVDDRYIYTVQPSEGTVSMAQKESPMVSSLGSQREPVAIKVRDDYVYWLNNGNGASDGEIVRSPQGELASAETLVSGLDSPQAFGVGESVVAWATENELWVRDLADGEARLLRSGFDQPSDLEVFGVMIFLTDLHGLTKVRWSDGEVEKLESRGALGLAVACHGAYAHLWYDDRVVRYGK